ncbi:DUF7563 family protein [Halorarum salinum]
MNTPLALEGSNSTCRHCSSHVSEGFRRVFAAARGVRTAARTGSGASGSSPSSPSALTIRNSDASCSEWDSRVSVGPVASVPSGSRCTRHGVPTGTVPRRGRNGTVTTVRPPSDANFQRYIRCNSWLVGSDDGRRDPLDGRSQRTGPR